MVQLVSQLFEELCVKYPQAFISMVCGGINHPEFTKYELVQRAMDNNILCEFTFATKSNIYYSLVSEHINIKSCLRNVGRNFTMMKRNLILFGMIRVNTTKLYN